MCEYCNLDKFQEHWIDGFMVNTIAEGSYTELNIIYNKTTKKFLLEASGEGNANSEMKFCFNCGIEL